MRKMLQFYYEAGSEERAVGGVEVLKISTEG